MKLDTIDFYWFSGTGNTLLVVKKMKEVFEENGVTVNLYHIEKSGPASIDTGHTIGFGFPVAEQGTYPFVWEFAKALPSASGTSIFMVDTLLAYSGGIVGPMKKIVKSKGYDPIAAREILMPNNLFPKKISAEKNALKISNGLKNAEQYALALIRGSAEWPRIPVYEDLMGMFSQWQLTWKLFRKLYGLRIDKQKCRKCGLCARLCPIKDIKMDEYPSFSGRCVFCMRCISYCPTHAISRKKNNFERYHAVPVRELLES